MDNHNITEQISEVAQEQFNEIGLEDCFLIEVIRTGKKLEVFIDSDEGVRFNQCQRLSRALESYLDADMILGEDYVIEVSSPGVDRPLKFRRQYHRHIGRKLDLLLTEDRALTGKLESIEDPELTFKVQGAKKGQFKTIKINFDEILSAKVQISFSKKKS